MLSFFDGKSGGTRRDFLRVGSLGLGGLSLPGLLGARSAAAAGTDKPRPVTDKSVIFLFLHGGPSQYETFDPKMTAPAEVRSTTGEIPTALPGVTFGSTFERLAKLARKLAVVRSYTTGNGNHDIKPIVCADTFAANMGSLYARVAGANRPGTGMPTNAALFPQSVDTTTQPANMGFGRFWDTGKLGSAFAPFVPGGKGELQADMKLSMPLNRLDDRRSLLKEIDRARWSMDDALDAGPAGAERFREQAFNVILGGISEAFDLAKEAPATLARYDTAPLVREPAIDKKWNNHKNYLDNAKSVGKLLLLARRLCEAGAGFVTVTTNFVWDMHADKNNAGCAEGMRYMGAPLDHAVSALIEDLEARGLSDKILLVVSGEMGRTPKINKGGGRDHWGNIAPLLLSGGGLKMGQVIGQSSYNGGEPNSDPYTIKSLVATVMHTLFDIGEVRVTQGLPTDLVRAATEWEPIKELF